MHKISCRRRTLSIFTLIILVAVILSLIPQQTRHCSKRRENLSVSFSSIPPQYLLIPYEEYISRTSIICPSVKLDQPTKVLSKFHPHFSPYLRGTFPLSLRRSNTTFEQIPYRFEHGMWHPVEVKSAQRTAILVPFKGKDVDVKTFLFNMHAFARRQLLTYTIILMEQVKPVDYRFNRGRLLNSAVRYLQQQTNFSVTCFIFHDPELLPEDDGNLYACESKYAKHTISRLRRMNRIYPYQRQGEVSLGGVLLLTQQIFTKVNGFSNLFWDGSGENDDLALRFIREEICVVRSGYEVATYVALSPPRHPRNNVRFDLLTWSTLRMKTDGYNQIHLLTRIISVKTTPSVTHLQLDVDVDPNSAREKTYVALA